MRILVAHNVGREPTGGMSRIMGFVHREVAAAGHTVEWLSAEDVPARWRGGASRFGFPWLVRRAMRAAARAGRPYDLVNVHEPHGALAVLGQSRLTRHGVVVTSHGVEQRAWELALEEARLGREGPSLRSRMVYPATSLWQSRMALRRATLVFVLSSEDQQFLRARFGIAEERIRRMRPGADEIFAAQAAGRSYAHAHRLVFPATWRKNKGIEDLVPAFAALAARDPARTLTILGAGADPAVVTARFPAAVRDRIRVIPAADDRTSAEALASADVMVLPSLFEGTPLTLIESMMSGLPIVTTATCGMRDTVGHERTALLVPLRSPGAIVEAVERLAADPALRERLGRAAQMTARTRYTWPAVAAEVLAAYQGLASRAS